jgi:hypothetical protein
MASCPACGRKLALTRPACLYCGASLPPEAVAGAPPDAATPAATAVAGTRGPQDRVLLLLELAGTAPELFQQALGLSRYEASLLARRGGLLLVRAAEPSEAEADAERLRGHGAAPVLVPEREVREPPLVCLGGERGPGELRLRSEEGVVVVRRGDAFLVVRGEVTREYPPVFERRRIDTARLEPGRRVHLHLRLKARPLEIDALNFELGFAVTGSAQLEIDAWVDEIAGAAKRDDGFRRLAPVLGPAQPGPSGALTAVAALGSAARAASAAGEAGAVVLDNLDQFRFYSGCLAAVERRRLP